MAEELRESHVLYQAICRLYAGVLDDKVGELDYLKPIRKVVDTAVVQGLGRTLTPDFYRGLVKTAMEEAGYPADLSDEVSNLVANAVDKNFQNPRYFRNLLVRPGKDDLVKLLEETHGNITYASRELGVNRVTLYKWLDEAGVDVTKYRPATRLGKRKVSK